MKKFLKMENELDEFKETKEIGAMALKTDKLIQ